MKQKSDNYLKLNSNVSNPRSSFSSIHVQPVIRASIMSIGTELENNIINNLNIPELNGNESEDSHHSGSNRTDQNSKVALQKYGKTYLEGENENKSKGNTNIFYDVNAEEDDDDFLDFNKGDYIKSYIKKATQDMDNKFNSNQIKKSAFKPSANNMNRSFVDFEQERYADKNASFLQVNEGNNSSDEDNKNLNRTSIFQTIIRPDEVLSKEGLRDRIKLFEHGNETQTKPIRKKRISHKQPQNRGSLLENVKDDGRKESIEKNRNKTIQKGKTSVSTYNIIKPIDLNLIQNTNNENYSNNKNKKSSNKNNNTNGSNNKIKIRPMSKTNDFKENENMRDNINSNKFWNNIDAAFDSPREREMINFDGFEEDNEMVYFNLSSARDNHIPIIKTGSNPPTNGNKNNNNNSEQAEDDEFVLDGRNKKIFSFYNKGGKTFEQPNQNNKSKIPFETISESIAENQNENSQILVNEKPKYKGVKMVIENNISESIIDRYINNPEIQVVNVNNFELKNFNKNIKIQIENDFKNDQEVLINQQSEEISLNNFSLNPSPKKFSPKKSNSDNYKLDINNYIILQKKKGNKVNLEAFLQSNPRDVKINSDIKTVSDTPETVKILTNNGNNQLEINKHNIYEISNENRAKIFNADYIETSSSIIKNGEFDEIKSKSETNEDTNENINTNQLITHGNGNKSQTTKDVSCYKAIKNSKQYNIPTLPNDSKIISNINYEILINLTDINDKQNGSDTRQYLLTSENNSKLSSKTLADLNKRKDINTINNMSKKTNSKISSPSKDEDEVDSYYMKYIKQKLNKDKDSDLSNSYINSHKSTLLTNNSKKNTINIYNANLNNSSSINENSPVKSNIVKTQPEKEVNKNFGETLNIKVNTKQSSKLIKNSNNSMPNGLKKFINDGKTKIDLDLTEKSISNNEDGDINLKNKIHGEIDKSRQYVVLQKQLPYSKYNLDVQRKNKIHNKNEVLYNNVADYYTLNQLINSVKRACKNHINRNNIHYNIKKINYRSIDKLLEKNIGKSHVSKTISTDRVTDRIKHKENSERLNKTTVENYMSNRSKTSAQKHDNNNKSFTSKELSKTIDKDMNKTKNLDLRNFYSEDPIDENVLFELLEEIKQRTQNIQKYFNDKEKVLSGKIKSLNETIDKYKVNEKWMLDEICSLKLKVDELVPQQKKELETINTTLKSNDDNRTYRKNLIEKYGLNNIHNTLHGFTPNNGDRLDLSALNDLGEDDEGEMFSKKNKLPHYKSFALILKDIGLLSSTFYDDGSYNKLEDDICNCIELGKYDNKSEDNFNEHVCADPKWNYKQAFKEYPKLKILIKMMAKKIKYDNKSRLKLEEKTLKIFTNDLKAIEQLDQKVKKLEHRSNMMKNNKINVTAGSINKSSDLISREEIDA